MIKYKKVDLAWLAAAIDGEGSIYCHSRYNGTQLFKIIIMNTDIRFINKAKRIVGYDVGIETKIKKKHELGKKNIYTLSIANVAILRPLLKQLIPHLVIKKDKAINALYAISKIITYKSKHFKVLEQVNSPALSSNSAQLNFNFPCLN